MKKYALLWHTFKTTPFTNKEAQKALKEKDGHLLSVLFYDLKRYGWMDSTRNGDDKRKKSYNLKEPNEVLDNFTVDGTTSDEKKK